VAAHKLRAVNTVAPEGWQHDPVGRHDFRLWSGTAWTDHVADNQVLSVDPIVPLPTVPVTIRPSIDAFKARFRGVQVWRWILSALLIPVALLILYLDAGWPAVAAMAAFGLLCATVLPVLYFTVMTIHADERGIEIRNQVGFRRFVPRERIAAISVGRSWTGGLRTADYAFIVSGETKQLGRFLLYNWNPEDFRLLAAALGLTLYGRPGRRLDEVHSGRNVERTARYLAGSAVTGVLIAAALTVGGLVVVAIVILAGTHR